MDNKTKIGLTMFKAKSKLNLEEMFALGYLLGHMDGAVGAAKSINNLSDEEIEVLSSDVFNYDRLESDWKKIGEAMGIKLRPFVDIVSIFN